MTHVYITEEVIGFSVRYGDLMIHVDTYEHAMSLALAIGTQLGLLGY